MTDQTTTSTSKEITFKIGMIAPKGVGKTSLLTSICKEIQKRTQRGGVLSFVPTDTRTKEAMSDVLNRFQTIISNDDDLFEIPQFLPTSEANEFKYTISISGANVEINFSIMDYPGGMLGCKDFISYIQPHIRQSVALLVPISTDILLDWQQTKERKDNVGQQRNFVANKMLDVDSVMDQIQFWLGEKERNNERAQLFFVPVKCEKYFDDNGGFENNFEDLYKAVKTRFIDKLQLTPKMKGLIEVNVFCVDTYGIAELRNIEFSENEKKLTSYFRRRLCEDQELHMKNAYELLISILKFQIDKDVEELKSKSALYSAEKDIKTKQMGDATNEKENIGHQIQARKNGYNILQWLYYTVVKDDFIEKIKRTQGNLDAAIKAMETDLNKLGEKISWNAKDFQALQKAMEELTKLFHEYPNRQRQF